MTKTKITKRDCFATITAVLNAANEAGFGLPEGVTFDDLTSFVAHEVELLDNKAVAAAKRAEKKRAAGDALREKIQGVLTGEFQTLPEINSAIGDPAVSIQMLSPRLKALVDLGVAEKDTVATEGADGKTKKAVAYRLV